MTAIFYIFTLKMKQHPIVDFLQTGLAPDTELPIYENDTIEFKQGLGSAYGAMARSITGFLNTEGGIYLIGINNDSIIKGITRDDADQLQCCLATILVKGVVVNIETGATLHRSQIKTYLIELVTSSPPKLYIMAIQVEAAPPLEIGKWACAGKGGKIEVWVRFGAAFVRQSTTTLVSNVVHMQMISSFKANIKELQLKYEAQIASLSSPPPTPPPPPSFCIWLNTFFTNMCS